MNIPTLDFDALWKLSVEEAEATAKLCYPQECEQRHVMIGRMAARLFHERTTPPRGRQS